MKWLFCVCLFLVCFKTVNCVMGGNWILEGKRFLKKLTNFHVLTELYKVNYNEGE